MLDYEVLSESEAMQERFQLLPDGEYGAVIDDAKERNSKTGNPMIELTLSVYDMNGKAHTVKDYLVFTRGMMWKVIHCAESAGLIEEYNNKKFGEDILRGRNINVKIGIEKGAEIPFDKLKGKPVGTHYSDKNKVEDYLKKDGINKQSIVKDDSFIEDDLPF